MLYKDYTDEEAYKEVKIETIYVSGKITGVPDLNKEKFRTACLLIKELKLVALGILVEHGYDVRMINPHKLPVNHNKTWESYMRVCLRALCTSDQVYVLDDWNDSKGAIVEVLVAKILGIPVFELATMDLLKVSYFYLFRKLLFKL